MLRPDEFDGHYFNAPYEVDNFTDLVNNIVEEIIFYGSGFGWANSGIKIRKNADGELKVAILFPYVKQAAGESQVDYIRKLMREVRKELRRQITTGGIGRVSYQAIDGFEYGVTRVAKDIHKFALVLKK